MNSTIYIVLLMSCYLHVAECVIFSWLWNVNPQAGSSNQTSSIVGNPLKRFCTKDHSCGKGRFCHRFYGTCHKCKVDGDLCRRDHVCCKGFECVFGSCRKTVRKGNFLAKCKKDKDCHKGLCCAKSHGEFVCKPKLKENQLCSVLKGGVAYSVNHGCPCDEGLICKRWRGRKRLNGADASKDKKKKPLRRCKKI